MKRRPFLVAGAAAALTGCAQTKRIFYTLVDLKRPGPDGYGCDDNTFPYIQHELDAYISPSSAPAGSTVQFFIRCNASTYQSVSITIYKLDSNIYFSYNPPYPTSLSLVAPIPATAVVQIGATPQNPTADQGQATNGCVGWSATAFQIPSSWGSDLYFAQIQSNNASTTAYTLVPFIVRPNFANLGTRPIAVVLPEYTYQAYNPWGNANLYLCKDSNGPFPTVSFNRPYASPPNSHGTNRFSDSDFYIRNFLSNYGNNFQADYFLSSDLELNPSALRYYKMFISIFHDEYWTDSVWNAYHDAILNKGGQTHPVNAAFLGGNTGFWKPKWTSSTRQLTIYKTVPYSNGGPWPPTDWTTGQDQTGWWWDGCMSDAQHPVSQYAPGRWTGGGPMVAVEVLSVECRRVRALHLSFEADSLKGRIVLVAEDADRTGSNTNHAFDADTTAVLNPLDDGSASCVGVEYAGVMSDPRIRSHALVPARTRGKRR